MRVIIAGTRDFNDFKFLEKETIKIFQQLKDKGYNTSREKVTIVSGNARGTDRLGEIFADRYKLNKEIFCANWNELGKRAGYVRNEDMALFSKEDEEIGVLIAFWDGESKGTKHMIDLAYKHKLEVFVLFYNNK